MSGTETAQKGAIGATEADIRKAEAVNELLVRPIGVLPQRPGDPVRPFAIGLFDEIRSLLKPGVGVTVLRRAVSAFVHGKRYYMASAQPGAMRHDIDGNPVEPLSDEDRSVAQRRLISLKSAKAEKAKPAPAPVPAPPPPPALSKAELIRASLLSRRREPTSAPR
ncbi:ProQ/FINO family protein (plasmid) [Neorhizobium sp. SOG26]|uniref:ProQ/FINO family protein n=1 Tax=Neorhizobium sp. SOG26 TaxID=2060726 RepID=UPI000E56B44F|nr:ProQ/FINO family protein [Neorhizobium sp. SOG26]AXV18339.1 ProQ/FINO family protein [Neorhizobium sp. SOG26]